jgi:two-component system, chemotaxis family, protein-glutamate methylesterase/glutaminase
MKYDAIIIGTSAGGLLALTTLLEPFSALYPVPILIVQHRSKDERTLLEEVLSVKCKIAIKQADEKEKPEKGVVYFAPPDYHLLVERDHTLSLSQDAKVHYSRPSIDILFETAAYAYKSRLLAIILTGANADGAAGIKIIKKLGGTTIAQNPATAQFPVMPQAAIKTGCIDKILDLNEIRELLIRAGKT